MCFNRIFLCFLCLSLFCFGCNRAPDASVPQEPVLQTSGEADFISTLTFLGDSTTAHMISRAKVQPTQVWASKNRYLNLSSRITYEKIVNPKDHREMTIAEVAANVKPQHLVITLGIDYGVYYYRNDLKTFGFYYEKLLDAITDASPDTTLILQSIFPVGRGRGAITNDMVRAANGTIAEIAQKRGLVFVNATNVLCDDAGYLKDEYCYSDDGIHVTATAYTAILENLKTYEDKIRATP